MRALIAIAIVAGTAHAQPGSDPLPPPQSYVSSQLSADDAAILQRGEISDGERTGGALVGWLVGFGAGQAVQGRYRDTGWIFTLGDAASMAMVIYGFSKICFLDFENTCDSSGGGYLAAGMIGLLVFRVWEITDAIVGPKIHNRRVREIHRRLGNPLTGLAPFVSKARDGGGTAGVVFRF